MIEIEDGGSKIEAWKGQINRRFSQNSAEEELLAQRRKAANAINRRFTQIIADTNLFTAETQDVRKIPFRQNEQL